MEKIDNNIQLAFLGGMKTGLEALIHGLEVVAENNNGQVSFEFVKMVSASTIADVELKLSSIENGFAIPWVSSITVLRVVTMLGNSFQTTNHLLIKK